MRRKQSFGAKQQICRVLTGKLSFSFCGARAHRDPLRTPRHKQLPRRLISSGKSSNPGPPFPSFGRDKLFVSERKLLVRYPILFGSYLPLLVSEVPPKRSNTPSR